MVTLVSSEDPAITELERIIKTELVMPCSFLYANLFEANFGLDQMKDVEFPVFVYFANDKSKYKVKEYGMQTRVLNVVGMMLQSRQDPSVDYSSKDINPDVNMTRQLVENLIYRLNKSTLSVWGDDKDKGGVDDFECENVYQKFDAHLFGVGVSFEWRIRTTMGAYIQ
jgi:hypothetical protein